MSRRKVTVPKKDSRLNQLEIEVHQMSLQLYELKGLVKGVIIGITLTLAFIEIIGLLRVLLLKKISNNYISYAYVTPI